MQITKVFEQLIKESKFKKAELARSLGLTPQALDNRLHKTTNPKTDSVIELLNELGYQLVVTKKGTKLPQDSFVISNDDPESNKEN